MESRIDSRFAAAFAFQSMVVFDIGASVRGRTDIAPINVPPNAISEPDIRIPKTRWEQE
jgi:hypothetical protein